MSDRFFPALNADNGAVALIEGAQTQTYQALDERINRCTAGLLDGRRSLDEERLAFLLPASLDYVTVLFAAWRAGAIAVPLNIASALPELEHYLGSAGATRLVVDPAAKTPDLMELCASLGITVLAVDTLLHDEPVSLSEPDETGRALMIFTSGTTSKPKGVISTHANVRAQITTLVDAWQWADSDVIPLILPLHHVHGVINVLCCALWTGASVDLFPALELPTLTERVAAGRYSVFMAVPTIYVKLIAYLNDCDSQQRKRITGGFANMRLNVSGSAACPVKVFDQWRDLTGQVLLERYGMTEIGMALSNPYHGDRRAGHVGQPLPGVEVQLFDEGNTTIIQEGVAGEIRIKGATVFLEYWNNEAATQESFHQGWFCTGDVAVVEDGYYRIMGRSSIDIIKSGGYKLSALEIEGVLLNHPAIGEVAVLGISDDTWGEAVLAVVALKENRTLEYAELREWCDGKMAAYKIPKSLIIVDALPRNAMGKVTKPELRSSLSY